MTEENAIVERRVLISRHFPGLLPSKPKAAADALRSLARDYRKHAFVYEKNLKKGLEIKYHAEVLPEGVNKPVMRVSLHVSKNGIELSVAGDKGKATHRIPWEELEYRNPPSSLNAPESKIAELEEAVTGGKIFADSETRDKIIFTISGKPVSTAVHELASCADGEITEKVIKDHIKSGHIEEIGPEKYVVKRNMYLFPLYGANAATFYVPKDVNISGNPGHSKVVKVQNMTAEEFVRRIRQKRQEQESKLGRVKSFLRKLHR